MPRTARQLVRTMREFFADMATDQYRDGFATDPNTDPDIISMLGFLNVAQRKMGDAGYKTQQVDIATTPGQMTYPMPSSVGRIIYVTYTDSDGEDKLLIPRTIQQLSENVEGGDFTRTPGATPSVYVTDARDTMLFWRRPRVAGLAHIRCTAVPNDMVAETDTPDGIPDGVHDAMAFLGCFFLTVSDSSAVDSQIKARSLLAVVGDYQQSLQEIVDARSILSAIANTGG